jgi:hypothetical protein
MNDLKKHRDQESFATVPTTDDVLWVRRASGIIVPSSRHAAA